MEDKIMKNEIFERIRNQMLINETWEEPARLVCVSERVIMYNIRKNRGMIEIKIVSDDSFYSEESPTTLFQKERITYLSYKEYDIGAKNMIEYCPFTDCGLN